MVVDKLFGGFFAGGGAPPVGKVSVVGEEGPELFVPRTSGTIVPNDALMGARGESRTVVVNITQNFAAGVTRAEIAGLAPQIVKASKAAVIDAMRRGEPGF